MLRIFLMNCIIFTRINTMNGLNKKDAKKRDYKKLRLTDDYEYESEAIKKSW